MKNLLLLAPLFCLAACSLKNAEVPSPLFPLQIVSLRPSFDAATGNTDVAIEVRNTDGYTLRSARLTLVGYNAHGDVTGHSQTIDIAGPLDPKDNSGNIRKAAVWPSANIKCVDVISAQVTSMSYATDHASGLLAKAIVKDRDLSRCSR